MEKVQKEVLTKDDIISDLLLWEAYVHSNKTEIHYAYIILPILFGSLFAALTGIIYLALIFLVLPIYHLYLLIKKIRNTRMRRARILNSDISIKTDVLERITTEQIYEPRYSFGRTRHNMRTVTYFYFSMRKWRVPNVMTHYDWSPNFYLSTEGLINTSVEGNEFYLVSIKDEYEVGYAYNKKFFELSKDLKQGDGINE